MNYISLLDIKCKIPIKFTFKCLINYTVLP